MSAKRWASWAGAVVLAAAGAVLWTQPAQALVPDRFGFALWSGGAVSQAIPVGTSVSPVVPGRWIVKFPGQGIAGGVVHVTAVHDALSAPNGRFCQAEKWAPDASVPPNEIVQVACYRTTGVLDPLPGFSVQFSASVDAAGAPVFRSGTTDAAAVVLEDCGGCGVSGWGWQDNGYGTGVLGPVIYFATSGAQTIRVQRREDGISIDQIVLSPGTYLKSPPGAVKNDNRILPPGS